MRAGAPGHATPAIEAGIAYLTEDRKLQGLFLDHSVHENINLIVAGRDARRFGRLDRAAGSSRTERAIRALGIRVPHARVNVGALSGGNQQKVMLSRLLEIRPRVLILDEPTRGVDIGAKSEIYALIDALARQGVAILLISSELPEVVGLCDRVLVMRAGRSPARCIPATARHACRNASSRWRPARPGRTTPCRQPWRPCPRQRALPPPVRSGTEAAGRTPGPQTGTLDRNPQTRRAPRPPRRRRPCKIR